MSSKWQANKIGLVNFWYYDEQEFPFVKGRMLLRGSNGSGKSVTMQSVVPLLLDGNMSPERLDPFGSRDRKMSSYLLEEGDNRQERTGYLYMEFKRQDSDTYTTIGMGICAKKGKPLDKWYFGLSDGRRVGQDFLLYKETDEKIPLSKRELVFRIQGGGQVFDRQSEYMEYVNRQIFGFDTVDEYKEMIDLLIQLRTPKLSKDFKPSVINEILSDSLQPLSEDDLRPMAEAIENMDTLSMNLRSRKEAKQAAEKIQRIFDKYNRYLLFEKAGNLSAANKNCQEIEREIQKLQKEIEQAREQIGFFQEEHIELEAKKAAMEKEKESLNQSDAISLKNKEMELKERIQESQKHLEVKEQQLTAKQDAWIEIENKKKQVADKVEEKEEEWKELLEEMQEEAEEMAFEEHAFFEQEFLAHTKETFSFQTHQTQAKDTQRRIQEGTIILKELDSRQRQMDEKLIQRDKKQREIDSSVKKLSELESVFVQTQNEWKEELFSWNGKNQKIHLNKEQLQELSLFAQKYREDPDYSKVLELLTEVWSAEKGILEIEKQEVLKRKTDTELLLKQEKQKLKEWENDKEPEPDREEAVIQNRKQLQELGIPYQEFYKVIEFGKELKEEECDQLEEALLRMGILDALLIDEQYREKVLSLKNGTCDRYLFVQKHRAEKSVLDVLDVNENINDLFHNQKIISILQNIAYDSEGITAILKNGNYQIGILTGTLTGTYKAGLLGTQAREKNRQEQIALCKQEIEKFEAEIEELIEKQKFLEEESQILLEEYRAFPKDQNLKTALQMQLEEERILEQKKEAIQKLEEEIKEIKTQMQEQKTKVLLIAEKLYLSCNYQTFLQAEKAANDYEKNLLVLQSLHQMYLQFQVQITDYEEQMENLDMDLDQIRYEQQVLQRNIKNDTEEWKSVTEQLQLTDYEKIKERMQICLEWLKNYPSKIENCIREETSNQNKLERCIEEKQNKLLQADFLKQEQSKQEKIYEAEAALDYVDIEQEIMKNPTKVSQSLSSFCENQQKDNLVQNLNKIYFENRGFLTDYQLAQTELFTELEENLGCVGISRMDLCAKYKGTQISSKKLLQYLEEEIEELESLIHGKDRELFEDILANTVSRKIRGKINASNTWVGKMNQLMNSMNTSSGLVLSLRWRSKTAEQENQLDTKELVDLLKKDYRVMKPEEAEKLSNHFRSKVNEARRHAQDSNGTISFYQVMRDTLDYRKWFEFQLFYQKAGERMKELTNSMFGTFSGGEKAMSMYVPLFSAVVAKYQSCSKDAPRLISLDEAFAGVDNRNIRDMFRLMTEFEFDFIINSQVLWGDCDTLDALAIYQLQRPLNAKFVTVMPYLWNGKRKELLEHEREMEERTQA